MELAEIRDGFALTAIRLDLGCRLERRLAAASRLAIPDSYDRPPVMSRAGCSPNFVENQSAKHVGSLNETEGGNLAIDRKHD